MHACRQPVVCRLSVLPTYTSFNHLKISQAWRSPMSAWLHAGFCTQNDVTAAPHFTGGMPREHKASWIPRAMVARQDGLQAAMQMKSNQQATGCQPIRVGQWPRSSAQPAHRDGGEISFKGGGNKIWHRFDANSLATATGTSCNEACARCVRRAPFQCRSSTRPPRRICGRESRLAQGVGMPVERQGLRTGARVRAALWHCPSPNLRPPVLQ
jgi:hypothetical protein